MYNQKLGILKYNLETRYYSGTASERLLLCPGEIIKKKGAQETKEVSVSYRISPVTAIDTPHPDV